MPGEPRNVKVEVINSTSIEVSWTPPDEKERHGIIRGYQIHVQNMNRVRASGWQEVESGGRDDKKDWIFVVVVVLLYVCV